MGTRLIWILVLVAMASCAEATNTEKPKQPEPDVVRVQHVLIGFRTAVNFQGSQMTPAVRKRSRSAAEALAQEVLERARKGEDFTALMRELSDDPGAGTYRMTNTGRPRQEGVYQRSGMAPSFGDVSFQLDVGEVGMATYDEKKSGYGWHIIKRLE